MPDYTLEKQVLAKGYTIIAGVDEAGRGPWAGPVVAGAAILDIQNLPKGLLSALDDSKKLKAEKRSDLFKILQAEADAMLGIGSASVEEIDELNILQATMLAMSRAVVNLPVQPDMALIDGNRIPALPCDAEFVIKGDGRSLSIAAASIVAKVTRDRIMDALAVDFPHYGWERNSGYGTKLHQEGLAQHGITPHHRRSFKPIRQIILGTVCGAIN